MFAVFKIPYRDPYRFIPPTASQKQPRHQGVQERKKWWRHMPVERWDLGETALHDLCCLQVFQTPTTCEISFMRWVIFIHQWKRWCWPNGGQGCLGSTARCKKKSMQCSLAFGLFCCVVFCLEHLAPTHFTPIQLTFPIDFHASSSHIASTTPEAFG